MQSQPSALIEEIKKFTLLNWLTIAAFVMSLATWVRTSITSRRNLQVEIIAYGLVDEHGKLLIENGHYIAAVIKNMSRLPISVYSFTLSSSDFSLSSKYTEETYVIITNRTGERIDSQVIKKTTQLPINLGGLSSVHAILLFDNPERNLEKHATNLMLQISTTRGPIKRKISLTPLPPLHRL